MNELLPPSNAYDYPLGRRVAVANAQLESSSIRRSYEALTVEELLQFEASLPRAASGLVYGRDGFTDASRDIGEVEYLTARYAEESMEAGGELPMNRLSPRERVSRLIHDAVIDWGFKAYTERADERVSLERGGQ